MSQNLNYYHRRSIRLKGYDYSQEGLYFITICVQNKECLFGDITVVAYPCVGPFGDGGRPDIDGENGHNDILLNDDISLNGQNDISLYGGQPQGHAPTMRLNDAGKMIEKQWLALPDRFPNVQLHEFVVMPNHFHGILEIVPDVGANPCGRPSLGECSRPLNNKTVGDMMDAFKSITTVEYIRGVKTMDWKSFNGKLWQRNYYEHIIRDYDAFVRISQYIRENPRKWGGT